MSEFTVSAGMAAAIPVLFVIDAENDDGDPSRTAKSAWSHVEECFGQLEPYRARLSESTGSNAQFNWMVRADAQVEDIYGDADWGLRQYAATWKQLRVAGDDIGLHPHGQRWSEAQAAWVGSVDPAGWVESVLEMATESYRRIFAASPTTLRFGNRFMNQKIATHAESLGFRYDLTVEPGYAGRSGDLPEHRLPGPCPNYYDAPKAPYRPGAGNFLAPEPARRAGMWFIPMSTAPVDEGVPHAVNPYYRALGPERNVYEVLHLRMPPQQFRRAVEHLLHELARPYLAVVIRCEMIRMPEVWANLEILRTHPRARDFAFTTAAKALRTLGCEPGDA